MAEWWQDAVIYQIYPRSFQDSTGSGIGDLPGITRRLEYVASLGVDGIWLSPFFASPQQDMGYDVSDYRAVDPLFGTLDDFDALVARAHDLGLKVIIDQVLSHTSDQHEWFRESRQNRTNPKADWYVWAEPLADGSPPTNWHSHFGGPAWEFDPARGQYYQHNFLISQPDLNYHCPDVVEAILDGCKFWLDRGVDGFRLDTVNYYVHDAKLRSNPPAETRPQVMALDLYGMQDNIYNKNRPENLEFLEKLRKLTDRYDGAMMVGEVGDMGARSIEIMARYTEGTSRLHMCYSFAMLGPDFTARHFRDCIEGFRNGAPDGHPWWSFSNHDVERHPGRWADFATTPEEMARMSATMLMCFPGTIGIFQGEELGQLDTDMEVHELTDPPALRFWPTIKGRDGCRTPMVWEASAPQAGFSEAEPWLPVKAPQAARAVDTQEAANDSMLHFYRGLIAFRKETPALGHGDTAFIDLPEPLLAFERRNSAETLTCIFNLSKDSAALHISGDGTLTGPSHARLDGEALTLPGNGYAILHHDGTLTVNH